MHAPHRIEHNFFDNPNRHGHGEIIEAEDRTKPVHDVGEQAVAQLVVVRDEPAPEAEEPPKTQIAA